MENMEKELTSQFDEFLKTKGLKAKFKLAFENMKESTKAQHEKNVQNFNQVKEQSIENNKDFYEFLQTKGLKAKIKLVIENIKKGAQESREKTKEQIARAKELGNPNKTISEEQLNKEFNAFLKQKGLDKKYIVTIEEVK
jgi:sulfatase maturation enzyme AslB (radical SAM superfamily)